MTGPGTEADPPVPGAPRIRPFLRQLPAEPDPPEQALGLRREPSRPERGHHDPRNVDAFGNPLPGESGRPDHQGWSGHPGQPGWGPDTDPGTGAHAAVGGAELARPRPFILTSGRVHNHDPEIGLETQVTARDNDPRQAISAHELPSELRSMVQLCASPVSVAEISARLRLPLGVTMILVSDLRAGGYIDVHTMDTTAPHRPETILRVIRGLRAIS